MIRVGSGQSASSGLDNGDPVDGAIASVDDDINQHNVVEGGPPVPAVAADAAPGVSRPDDLAALPKSPASPGALLGTATVASVVGDDGHVYDVRKFLLDVVVER